MADRETLRSTFLPLDTLAGTRLFLRYYPERRLPYIVETRWQIFYRTADIQQGIALFEGLASGELSPAS